MQKKYKLQADQIQRLLPEMGGGVASDKITVSGNKVDYMCRQESTNNEDSGWIFYGGGETQEFIDNPDNLSILSLNTIANYDPDIIEFLTYPFGTEIERNAQGKLELLSKDVEVPSTVMLFPLVEGKVFVSKSCNFEISQRLLRRFEKGNLVIWRPGFTIWLTTYSSNNKSIDERAAKMVGQRSEYSYDYETEIIAGLHKHRYKLKEGSQDSAYIIAFKEDQTIQMSIYYDNQSFLEEYDLIWKTLNMA